MAAMQEDVDPTRSGECLFRLRLARQSDPLLAHIPRTFLELLSEGASANKVPSKLEETRKSLQEMQRLARTCRRARVENLEESKASLKRFCTTLLQRLRVKFSRHQQHTKVALDKLDQQLATLVLHFYATLEKEMDLHARRVSDEERACERLESHVRASFELSKFALRLHAETGGYVTFRRLPQGHPQFLRCRRAALENVKAGFFVPEGRYTGITVMDVFKIDNKIKLKRFQRASANLETGKVKGLFCTLPSRSIERVVAFGMGSAPVSDEERAAVFRGTWLAAVAKLGLEVQAPAGVEVDWSKQGVAEQAVMRAEAVPFPRHFSRYSTLSEDARLVQTPIRPGTATREGGEEDATESPMRYLALCRVIVNKVFVTAKDAETFPSLPSSGSYSAMYSPKLEEYLLTNPADVLPEFLVQYKYVARPRTGAGSPGRGSLQKPGSWIIPTNLTQPLQPDTDTVGVPLANRVASGARGHHNSTFHTLLASVAAPLVCAQVSGRPLSSRSRARLDISTQDELAIPWQQLRANSARQRAASMSAVHAAVDGVWRQLKSQCSKDKDMSGSMRSHGQGGTSASATATKATIVALKESIVMAERELARTQGRRLELERDASAASQSQYGSNSGSNRRRRRRGY